MAKRGREREHFTTSWGELIPGLYRLADGRWIDQDDRKHPWTSPDERDAIREFRRRRSQRADQRIPMPIRTGSTDIADIQRAIEESDQLQPVITLDFTDHTMKLELLPPAHPFWQAVGELLRNHPKLAADHTGIKELAWLEDLEPPPEPLKLTEIVSLYEQKRFKDPNEAARSKTFWEEFCQAVAPAVTLKEVKSDNLKNYDDNVSRLGLAPKTVRNRYAKIGSILRHAYALRPAHRTSIQELRIEFRLVCKAPRRQDSEPDPIDPDDFEALFQAADLRWKAILLCMLNFAMHPKEVGEMLKREVNFKRLEFQTTRTKSGVLRVGRMWQETANSILAYQAEQKENERYKESPFLFLTVHDEPYGNAGLTQYFRETLKPRAQKEIGRTIDCTLDSIRDGAQNAADDGGADSIHTEMLMGHTLPGSMGSYKKRTVKKTDNSVECIHNHYGIAALIKPLKKRRKAAARPKER